MRHAARGRCPAYCWLKDCNASPFSGHPVTRAATAAAYCLQTYSHIFLAWLENAIITSSPQLSERAGGPDAFLAALAAHGAGERLRLQLAAVMSGQRLRSGGVIDGEEPEDSADPADDDELYGLVAPGLSEGGVGFVSGGSTPE